MGETDLAQELPAFTLGAVEVVAHIRVLVEIAVIVPSVFLALGPVSIGEATFRGLEGSIKTAGFLVPEMKQGHPVFRGCSTINIRKSHFQEHWH